MNIFDHLLLSSYHGAQQVLRLDAECMGATLDALESEPSSSTLDLEPYLLPFGHPLLAAYASEKRTQRQAKSMQTHKKPKSKAKGKAKATTASVDPANANANTDDVFAAAAAFENADDFIDDEPTHFGWPSLHAQTFHEKGACALIVDLNH